MPLQQRGTAMTTIKEIYVGDIFNEIKDTIPDLRDLYATTVQVAIHIKRKIDPSLDGSAFLIWCDTDTTQPFKSKNYTYHWGASKQ